MYQYDIKPCCILLCIVFSNRICVVICNVFSVFSDLQCVRLDEMKKYKQLLQHYTRYSLEKSSHSPERLGASQLLHYGYVCNKENI